MDKEIHKKLMQEDDIVMKQLLNEINDAGYEITDKMQLWTLKKKHIFLIPILIKYIPRFKTFNRKEFIIRALGVKGFTEATPFLLEEFYNNDNTNYKWAIGNSFEIILDSRYEEEYIEIVKNSNHGISRQMIVLTLGRLRSEKAVNVLLNLLDDEEVNGHAIIALGYYKDKKLITHIEPFLQHELEWKKREAEKSIKKIEKYN